MRISITARLIAAFLLVSVTGLALASVIANWLTVREFKQLSMEQARNRFVADATAYYDANGKWDGLTELNNDINKHTLAGQLHNMRDQLIKIRHEEEKRNWSNLGQAQYSEVVRKFQDNTESLCYE